MEIHKPKAAHSWREFLVEIGTIICGILIALGLEQLAEAQHWQHKIHEAENAMRLELAEDDGPQAYARLVAVACFDNKLDILARLASDRVDRRIYRRAALGYSPPSRTWDQQSWQSAVASDVSSHMGADEALRWSTPYRSLPGLARSAEEEVTDRSALWAVRVTDGPLTEAEADRAISIIADLRTRNIGLAFSGLELLHSMKQTGAEMTAKARADVLQQARAQFGACAHDPVEHPATNVTMNLDSDGQYDSGAAGVRALLGLAPLQ